MNTDPKVILVFIDWYLPAYKAGGPVRSMANLTARLKDEFEFRIVCGNKDYTDDTPLPGIREGEWVKRSHNEFVLYLSKETATPKIFRKIFDEFSIHRIYLNGLFSFRFSILPLLLSRRYKDKVIVASRGMLASGALGVKSGKKKAFLGLMKSLGLYRGITFHATNEDEEKDIRRLLPHHKIVVAPNLPDHSKTEDFSPVEKHPDELKIVCIARISPEKNQLFAFRLLEKVKSSGKIHFNLYGPVNDQEYWNNCLETAQRFSVNVSFTYHGAVPSAQLPEVIRQNHLLFLPTLGENFGHVILETLQLGRPVLISDRTPWKNLQQKNAGWDFPLEDKEAFLQVIDSLVRCDDSAFRIICENAFIFGKERTSDNEAELMSREMFR